LQPLLENAIKHGISHLVEGGTVVVECDLTGDELLLAVEKEPNRFRVEIHLPAPASEEQAEGTEELTT
jgi:two-component system LytT family sensor kinase